MNHCVSIADLSVSELIYLFNQDRKKPVGWTQGRLKFMTELGNALIASELELQFNNTRKSV